LNGDHTEHHDQDDQRN